MYATVTIVLDEHAKAVTVPTQAVLSDNRARYVFVLDSDRARRVTVKTGRDQGSVTEITEGLTGTEQVITTGQQYVRDGGPVILQQEQGSSDSQNPRSPGNKK